MSRAREQRIEFGDWQTPGSLAQRVCDKLIALGVRPATVVEPTCGVGAFVRAATSSFPNAVVLGFEYNEAYLTTLRDQTAGNKQVLLQQADFFDTDWRVRLEGVNGPILVIGNFPWVTNSAQGTIGGANLPEKSNYQQHKGFDAISGKANFDISEAMMLEVLRWFRDREGDIAMLIKTATARKVLAHVQRQPFGMREAYLFTIDAKKEFDASVEACLLVMRMTGDASPSATDYTVYEHLDAEHGRRVGHRFGLTVNDLDAFKAHEHLLGQSPQKWRSGVKHDLSAVMEFTATENGLINGLGEMVNLEPDYLFPLLKGSDIGSDKMWRGKYMLVTQHKVGEPTAPIEQRAPLTWKYLVDHAPALDTRGSSIYLKNPRFAVFGVGDYAFRPWRIAICGLYKRLAFRMIGPMDERPVMFDDTVYYVSFHTKAEASAVLERLCAQEAQGFLSSLIFWDEKRPIKTGVLNLLDWSRIGERMEMPVTNDIDLFTQTPEALLEP